MRVALALGLLGLAAAMPMTVGRWLLRVARPWAVIIFGWLALAALAVGFVVVLGASVGTSASPMSDLPGLVDRCLAAASQLWEHPLQHWPRIVASILLLAVITRLLYAIAKTLVAAHREADRALSLATDHDIGGTWHLAIVRSDRAFAFAAGIWRRRIVISDGLMSSLDAEALRAVIAHEVAHLSSWQVTSLLFARSVARAFPFIPPVKEAADQLVLGLEMHADAAAVAETDDPLLVARALVDVAGRSAASPSTVLSVTGGALAVRIGRLTTRRGTGKAVRVGLALALCATTLLLASLLVLLPVSARTLAGGQRAVALHGACHLPHPGQVEAL